MMLTELKRPLKIPVLAQLSQWLEHTRLMLGALPRWCTARPRQFAGVSIILLHGFDGVSCRPQAPTMTMFSKDHPSREPRVRVRITTTHSRALHQNIVTQPWYLTKSIYAITTLIHTVDKTRYLGQTKQHFPIQAPPQPTVAMQHMTNPRKPLVWYYMSRLVQIQTCLPRTGYA